VRHLFRQRVFDSGMTDHATRGLEG
jgi:hypothetical protein